ncbi:MAG: helix-turn-helix transcriptional regulator [Treponema sp.]|jgi:DNA-binding CsgD family transcriptional regulator|nr:helix-turn-helix transcriptional regulator [Treponema sp.]
MGKKQILSFVAIFLLCATVLSAQVASRFDGVNVFYYDSLHEAFADAAGTSVDQSDEITVLADIVLDEPLLIEDGVHIRLVANGNRTIQRSGNLIEFPVIWVRGEGASLSLGKPDMERTRTEPLSGVESTMRGSPLHELIIDGGYLNSTPIEAHSPLIALSGPDSKLIMYNRVTLQNNKNIGDAMTTNYYQNGTGVYIFTQGDIVDRQAEFIMKGGTIRGNINDTRNPHPCGGGVFLRHFGIFTMEGGVIMNNTVQHNGGGFYTDGMGSFKKTGGIIYGANAPAEYRNTALAGLGIPPCYGHAIAIIKLSEIFLGFRDDTVGENDNLSYFGNVLISGVFGEGEKWDTHAKAFRRMLFAIILPSLALVVGVFLVFWKRYVKKLARIVQEAADTTPYIDLEHIGLSNREKDLCELLLSDLPLKEIASVLGTGYSGAHFHVQNLYAKLGIEGRTELLVRVKSRK